jgi:hypothetical protein
LALLSFLLFLSIKCFQRVIAAQGEKKFPPPLFALPAANSAAGRGESSPQGNRSSDFLQGIVDRRIRAVANNRVSQLYIAKRSPVA